MIHCSCHHFIRRRKNKSFDPYEFLPPLLATRWLFWPDNPYISLLNLSNFQSSIYKQSHNVSQKCWHVGISTIPAGPGLVNFVGFSLNFLTANQFQHWSGIWLIKSHYTNITTTHVPASDFGCVARPHAIFLGLGPPVELNILLAFSTFQGIYVQSTMQRLHLETWLENPQLRPLQKCLLQWRPPLLWEEAPVCSRDTACMLGRWKQKEHGIFLVLVIWYICIYIYIYLVTWNIPLVILSKEV